MPKRKMVECTEIVSILAGDDNLHVPCDMMHNINHGSYMTSHKAEVSAYSQNELIGAHVTWATKNNNIQP